MKITEPAKKELKKVLGKQTGENPHLRIFIQGFG
jgi:Fe-S cluster assembly iron-binding protein IscA